MKAEDTGATPEQATGSIGPHRREFIRGVACVAGVAAAGEAVGVFAGGGLGSPANAFAADRASAGHTFPEAAYVRRLGVVAKGAVRPRPELPPGICDLISNEACAPASRADFFRSIGAGSSVAGLGIPLGGIGAGSFMINQCGTFGPWNMGGEQSSSFWEMRILPQAAFHIREQLVGGGGKAVVKTLAVPHEDGDPQRRFGSVLPRWNQLKAGEGSYAALYPFGYIDYDGFRSDVSMRFWSPIVAHEDERTSMPVAFFDIHLSNPTNEPIEMSTMFTFPNAPAHEKDSRRAGFYSRYDRDDASGIAAVTLGSDDPSNTPDGFKSEWTIAAAPADGQTVSHVTSWNASGDGGDIYEAFSEAATGGRLPNRDVDGSASAGAIAITLTLDPHQTSSVRFALSWDFPQVYYGKKETSRAVWMRRYTAFLGGKETEQNDYVRGSYPFRQGFNIARGELLRHDRSLADVESWWKPIAENADAPAWLRKSALNELYDIAFNNSFWESGLVSSTVPLPAGRRRVGSVLPNTHLAFTIDGGGGGAPSYEIDVDSYGYVAYAKLFPSLERGRMLPMLQVIGEGPFGRAAQSVPTQTGPYINLTSAMQGVPPGAAPSQGSPPPPPSKDLGPLFGPTGGESFRDCPHKIIYRTYALFKETGDDDLLRYAYAPLLKTLRYTQGFRPAGSHLPMDPSSNNPPNTMDQVPVNGRGIYNCQLYLLSLQILSVLTGRAIRLGVAGATPEVQRELDRELAAAKMEFDRVFWNPATGRYRFCDGTGGIGDRSGTIFGLTKPVLPSDAIWLEAFFAQGIAMQLGLPDLVNLKHAVTHLNNTIDAFLRIRDAAGNLMGAPMALDPDLNHFGKSLKTTEINEVIVGSAYMAAAAAVSIGRKTGDRKLVAKALRIGEGLSYQTYDVEPNGYAFMTPESWSADEAASFRFPAYSRARAVWSLLDAVAPISTRNAS